MKDKLSNLLQKYVNYFYKEYQQYLNKDQLEIIKNINYQTIIKTNDFKIPIGIINYGNIYISNNLLNITGNNNSNWLNNQNYASYLKYLNNCGCDTYEYYSHQLMFLVFKLVIGNDNGIINGFINYEVNNLRRKYKFQAVNLYKREEVISSKLVKLFGRDHVLKIMFMDMPSAFKYLNDNIGYRYAKLYYELSTIMEKEFNKLKPDYYTTNNALINYARDYDHLAYGDAYNCLLEFNINNKL